MQNEKLLLDCVLGHSTVPIALTFEMSSWLMAYQRVDQLIFESGGSFNTNLTITMGGSRANWRSRERGIDTPKNPYTQKQWTIYEE